MSRGKKFLKVLLFRANLLNLLTKLRYNIFHLLREGYEPRKFWDGWSDHYAKQKAQQRIDQSQYWLLKKMEELRPEKVLEVGCGFGRNLKFLLEHLSFPASLIGFDISETMVRKAKRNLNERSSLGCADVNALPFHEKSYDLVFTHAILMHVQEKNIENAIREMMRIAKKYLVIIEETYWSAGNVRGSILKPNEYTFIYDYAELLSRCGLKIEEIREEKGEWNLICLLCSKREPESR